MGLCIMLFKLPILYMLQIFPYFATIVPNYTPVCSVSCSTCTCTVSLHFNTFNSELVALALDLFCVLLLLLPLHSQTPLHLYCSCYLMTTHHKRHCCQEPQHRLIRCHQGRYIYMLAKEIQEFI